ncbi:MAG: ATP-binding cassette domain-containing protein [Planctomycetota bacterium]|jgi:ABC-type ATPase with predicted acetyltransferase domain
MFGLSVDRLSEPIITVSCRLEVNPGDIVYITGPSGAGKSVLLKELEQTVAASERVNLEQIELPAEARVIDCIEGDLIASLRILSMAGLNDVFCILNSPANLSDGQKWRFRLAMALAAGKKFIFSDEFCSQLDRVTAAVIAYKVQKCAKEKGVTFILASSHEDTLIDLSPDVIVTRDLSGQTQVVYKRQR